MDDTGVMVGPLNGPNISKIKAGISALEKPRKYWNTRLLLINTYPSLPLIVVQYQKSSETKESSDRNHLPLRSKSEVSLLKVDIEFQNETMSLIPSFFGNRRGGSSSFDPFSLDVWDPFGDFPFPQLSRENSAIVNTRVDWKETPEAHVFKADLPGLRKEEVKVEIEDDRVLQISGERNVEKEEKNDTWHRVERSSGKFMRRFRLPENAKMDQVKASMENGVLTVTVPKEEVKKPDAKSIEISG